MLDYTVSANRIDPQGSEARTKEAVLVLDTDLSGRPHAFNPAEFFLASIAACMLKGIERVTPLLDFQLEGASVRLHGIRQDAAAKMLSVTYELMIDTAEPDTRLELLHKNLRKYATISNTIASALDLQATMRRKSDISET